MWRFREIAEGEPERNPHEGEFFTAEEQDLSDALVREVIQNSLDARIQRSQPVRICFTFDSHVNDNSEYYKYLIQHLKSAELLPQEYKQTRRIRFLTIEDFGTSGLDGPITRFSTIKKESNYCDFWWREGISEKSGSKAGKWGLGKTVFHLSSQLRSFWGYTIRCDDKRKLLLGKSMLKSHHHDKKWYTYAGYYANQDSYEPIEDQSILQSFCRRFKITRTTEPGLSIVIPLPHTEIWVKGIIRSAIMHYFYPISEQRLVVEVRDDERLPKPVILDEQTLYELAPEQDWSETDWKEVVIDKLMDFIKNISGTSNKPMKMKCSNEISKNMFGGSLEQMRKSFAENNLLAFRVPVTVQSEDKSAKTSFFDVFLQKDESINKADEFYIRSDITIARIKNLGKRRVRALLCADDDVVAQFLRDSEPPAHIDWNTKTEGFKGKYIDAASTLRFIKFSLRDIINILDVPPAGRDYGFLKDIFFLKEPKPIGPIPPPPPPPPRPPPIFAVNGIDGGFRISLVKKEIENKLFPFTATVKVAYDIRRGNPFRRHNPLDFDLSKNDIPIRIKEGKIRGVEENEVQVKIEGKGFELTATNFDKNRDVITDVKEDKQ